uniref:PCI domain-containing protein n=1 Tax=Caenorhabditis japonica TaxID=281687 RepID=A0A8R1I243_CAEJA
MTPKAGEAAVEKMEVDPVKPAAEPAKDENAIAVENIKDQLQSLDKGEEHLVARVLHVLPKTRRQLNDAVLHKLCTSGLISHDSAFFDNLLKFVKYTPPAVIDEPMDTTSSKTKSPRKGVRPVYTSIESDCYLRLLVLIHLFAQKKYQDALLLGEQQLTAIQNTDKRTLDGFAAKTLYFLCVIHEREGKLFEIRGVLNSRLRTATLRHFNESQAVLICWLLRCYLINRQYQSAAHLVSKVAFPENATNNDLARYMYYQGRIKALQLDYNSAAGYFLQAQRKAPQEGAIGFKQTVQKWVVVIGLLQGEIPERNVFRQPIYRKCLAQYLDLTHAVRLGDIAKFNHVLEQHRKVFEADDTLTLIVRLRQNVIKTAIKQISLAYSRIYIKDIAKKLLMDNETETEYIVAKAIADDAIDAVITSDVRDGPRYMQSSETADIYRTSEPQDHFDTRIRYCLELHNQAVKALRYPPKKKIAVESIEQAREREQQELEFAKELADEDEDDF